MCGLRMRVDARRDSNHVTSHHITSITDSQGSQGNQGSAIRPGRGGGALPGPYSTSYGSTVSQARVTNIRHSLEQTVRVVQRTEWRGEANN